MRRVIGVLAAILMAAWTLLAWLTYLAWGWVMDVAARQTPGLAADFAWLVEPLAGLGAAGIVIIWLLGAVAIVVLAFIGRSIVGRRSARAPSWPDAQR